MKHRPCTIPLLALAALAGALLPAHAAHAAMGGTIQLPSLGLPPGTRPSGLRLEISTHWVECSGYRPVWVTLSSVGRAVADREVTIRLSPSDWSQRHSVVEFTMKLPQGAPFVRKEIAMPQQSIWQSLTITAYENGREVKDLSATSSLPRNFGGWTWTEAYPAILFIDADAPPPHQITTVLASARLDDRHDLPNILALRSLIAPLDPYSQNLINQTNSIDELEVVAKEPDDSRIVDIVQKLSMVALLSPQDLPTLWQNYTCFDLILISLSDARRMSENHPEAWEAMLQYVRTGGNLIVFGVGDDFSALSQLDRMLDATAGGPSGAAAEPINTWRPLRDDAFGSDLVAVAAPHGIVRNYQGGTLSVEEMENEADRDGDGDIDEEDAALIQPRPARQDLFRLRPLGWGRVLAAGPEKLDAIDTYHWGWAMNDLGPDRWRWYRRHGLSRQRINPAFWNYLIPGVGAAPVRTFLAMITGFMIIIGPVNYFLLNRARRLYLLLITVPLGSAVIIAGLFGFAVVKDGLGTRARLRSFSQFMPDGEVTSWSRQSFYAGMVPSSGLVYPVDAAVFPIEFDAQRRAWRRQLLRWGDAQQLASGYMAARTTHQNLVIHSSQASPPVQLQQESDGPPMATNSGSATIQALLIRDGERAYWLSDLAPGATAAAESVSVTEANKRYRQIVRDHWPTVPPGFTTPNAAFNYRYYYYNNFDSSFTEPDFASSLLEVAIGRPTQPDEMGRVYFAVTEETPPWVPNGVRGSRETAGFHVIQGAW